MTVPSATATTSATAAGGWRLEHTYAELPAMFHIRVAPTPVRDPHFVVFNTVLATELGLDVAVLDSAAGAAIFAGNALPDGALPLAQAYAGHQFGHFTGLGDGRALLLGEQITPDGRRVDVQLKGSGPTPYSRRGDGRAALGPMLRELVISEAMHALGIPTSRSLAVVSTGEVVHREQPLPGAVLTRIAASHLRVGTFEWAAAHRDDAALRALADYTIHRHYPEVAAATPPYLALFDAIVERQARLIAQWQLVGFIHGVMNTDNMSIAGESLDYGPCAFMDRYDPATVFSSIDEAGRYAYRNQPPIAQWNLARLAEAMLPLFGDDRTRTVELVNASLLGFETRFKHHWLAGMRAKLGLTTSEDGDPRRLHQHLSPAERSGRRRGDRAGRCRLPAVARAVDGASWARVGVVGRRRRGADAPRQSGGDSPQPQGGGGADRRRRAWRSRSARPADGGAGRPLRLRQSQRRAQHAGRRASVSHLLRHLI
jgi:uncharacterized protein YdiU (UPF0061 family)